MAMSLPLHDQAGRGAGNRNLICGVCREVYRSPRFLPCHHSFCLHCLEDLVSACGFRFPCPTCRQVAQVPPGGVQQFIRNFYIPDEELDRERNLNAPAMCSTHPMEELIFFCKVCDLSICSRCKSTKHEGHHGTVDLFEEAGRCKGELAATRQRLARSINRLTKRSALAQDNLKASREKTAKLKEQVHDRYTAIVDRATELREKVLEDLDRLTQEIEEDLSSDAQRVQQHLDALVQLQQRLYHALDSANDAEVVAVEKEMREGEGSVEELVKVERSLPTTTQRPGLQGDAGCLKDHHLQLFIGSPVKLQMSNVAAVDSVTPIYRCGEDESCREVHAICKTNKSLHVAFGGTAPEYNHESEVQVYLSSMKFSESVTTIVGGRFTYKNQLHRANKVDYLLGPGEVQLHGISHSSILLKIFPGRQRGVIIEENKSHCIRVGHRSDHHNSVACSSSWNYGMRYHVNTKGTSHRAVAVYSARSPLARLHQADQSTLRLKGIQTVCAFDANVQGNIFAIVGEDVGNLLHSNAPGNNSKGNTDGENTIGKRTVILYRRGHEDPVATYSPPQQKSFPTAVCFWKPDDSGCEFLLVADWLNDSVHVVRVENDQLHFVRYLAAGSGDLVRPTALYVDTNGETVWIGCENGWVLRCEPGPNGQEEEQEDDDWDGQPDFLQLFHVDNESGHTPDTMSQVSDETP